MKPLILIIDDDPTQLLLLKSQLKHENFEILEARNGEEALKIAKERKPQVILSDILMPRMDGFTLCRVIREDKELKETPFIFHTATYLDKKDRDLAFKVGADEFLIKPAERKKLIELLNHYIHKKRSKNVTIEKAEEPNNGEKIILKEYNAALIRKLEDKMIQLKVQQEILHSQILKLKKELNKKAEVEKTLKEQVEELKKRYQNGRKLQMEIFELKNEVNDLLKELGREPKYKLE